MHYSNTSYSFYSSTLMSLHSNSHINHQFNIHYSPECLFIFCSQYKSASNLHLLQKMDSQPAKKVCVSLTDYSSLWLFFSAAVVLGFPHCTKSAFFWTEAGARVIEWQWKKRSFFPSKALWWAVWESGASELRTNHYECLLSNLGKC